MALRRTEQFYLEATKRRKAEDALHRGQKLEALGQLTGGVAHDFNNLLTVIGSSADLLRKEDLPHDRRMRYVDAIADTVKRASLLTARLLTFARSRQRSATVFDVTECLDSISEIIRTLCGSRIEVLLPAAAVPLPVCADRSQFETAIINLAANARDAMPGDGRLTIDVSTLDLRPIAFPGADSGKSYVRISVRDTGSGIDATDLEHIFEPFFTTKDEGKGTGLGLSQVYGFAIESKGHVSADSEVGRGSTFYLYLPLQKSYKPRVSCPPTVLK
jgi:two-component system NtrC family sensor kinase